MNSNELRYLLDNAIDNLNNLEKSMDKINSGLGNLVDRVVYADSLNKLIANLTELSHVDKVEFESAKSPYSELKDVFLKSSYN